MMKILLLLAFGLTAVVAKKIPVQIGVKWEDSIKDYKNQCLKKSGADLKQVDDFTHGVEFANNEAIGCYYNCIYPKFNVIKEDGQFNVNQFTASFPWVSKESAKKCASIAKPVSPECKKSYEMAKCIIMQLGSGNTISISH
uniref:Uncharacterized protein n=1 Tax=Photinus pyralis TaxID=7054 RepID=A0A1Y1KF93_PHOPY